MYKYPTKVKKYKCILLYLQVGFFVMEQVKVKIGYRIHILIWSWRYFNNLYFVIYNFFYSQTSEMHA